jgi:integrase
MAGPPGSRAWSFQTCRGLRPRRVQWMLAFRIHRCCLPLYVLRRHSVLGVAAPHLQVLIVLLTEAGLRVNKEALALKWEDVDFQASQLRVIDSKTIAGRRSIPLSELCISELHKWKRLLGPEYSPYVFPNLDRPGHHLLSIQKTWSTALRAASVPYFPIYYLRATFASRLSALGVPDTFVAQMLGHSSTNILPHYVKAIDEFRRDAIRRLDEMRKTKLSTSERSQPVTLANQQLKFPVH